MTKIKFVNGTTPAVNATNLNQMQTNIENAINNKITPNNEFATSEYIDNKQVYRKRISGTWGSSNTFTIACGLASTSYKPIRFEAFLKSSSGDLFNINTPRGNGTNTDATQIYAYWSNSNNNFLCVSNGYSRQGSTVMVDLYYTKS